MAKPAGPACNLDCRYCFYTEKEATLGQHGPTRMTDEVLEAYVERKSAGRERKRLSVFRSSKHIYAQVIDDVKGVRSAPPLRSRRLRARA